MFKKSWFLVIGIFAVVSVFAEENSEYLKVGRYQTIKHDSINLYILDTSTGAVWISRPTWGHFSSWEQEIAPIPQ